MLNDRAKRRKSEDACLALTNVTTPADIRGKVTEFIDDHLVPARIENVGTELARRHSALQQSLERVLREYDDHQPATNPARLHLSDGSASATTPPTLDISATIDGATSNNTFHQARASTPAGSLSYVSGRGRSQLEQLYDWHSAEAVRGLLDLDPQMENPDGRE